MELTPAPIEETAPEAFVSPQASRDRPQVVRGLCAHWPAVALARQSDEAVIGYFKAIGSPKPVRTIIGEPAIKGAFFYGPHTKILNFKHGPVPLHAAMAELQRQNAAPDPASVFIQSSPVAEHFPAFLDNHKAPVVPEDIVPRIWMGNRTITQTHYDLYDNLGVVVAGRRRFTLFPPDQLANLYPGPFESTPAGTPISMVRLEAPDLDLYPRFAEAAKTAVTAELLPGDAIFIPYGWWHHVTSLEPINILINYWWNTADVPKVKLYDTLYHALVSFRDLEPRKREVWKTMFDYYVFNTDGQPLGHLPPDERGKFGDIGPDEVRDIKLRILETLKTQV